MVVVGGTHDKDAELKVLQTIEKVPCLLIFFYYSAHIGAYRTGEHGEASLIPSLAFSFPNIDDSY